jgi:hypothetical protein
MGRHSNCGPGGTNEQEGRSAVKVCANGELCANGALPAKQRISPTKRDHFHRAAERFFGKVRAQ